MIARYKYSLISLCIMVLLSTSGCTLSLGAGGNITHYYVLSSPVNVPEVEHHKNLRLLLRETYSSSFIDSHRIIYSRDHTTRAAYQYAQWVEPPPSRITTLLIQRLESANLFASVNREDSSVIGDVQLNLELIDFYHDVSDSPSKVIISLSAELIDSRTRVMTGRKLFHVEEESAGIGSDDAVNAFNTGLNKIFEELMSWLAELPFDQT